MEATKTTNKRRRRTGRAKKILSSHSRRVLQDLADHDWQLIESHTQRTISELNSVTTVTPHNQFLRIPDDGGEEKLEEKLEERSATARSADSNSQDKPEQNAQKATRGLPLQRRPSKRSRRRTRRRTRLPTLDSQKILLSPQIEKDEDKPMESYANVKEVVIYLTYVIIRYHMD